MEFKAFCYEGNKDREIKFFKNIVEKILNDDSIIVEPFGGSFSLIRHIFKDYGDKYKYAVNDINKKIIDIYKLLQKKKTNKSLIKQIKKLEEEITTPEQMKQLKKCDKLSSFLFGNSKYCIRPFIYPTKQKVRIKYERFENFLQLKNVKFDNKDFIEYLKKYENNENAIIFLDPPYFLSNNDEYICKLTDNYFRYIQILKDKKATFIIIVNSHILTNIFMETVGLFKIDEYDVLYMRSQKKTKHIIFSNKDIK